MRLILLSMCFIVALSACSFQVDVIETPTAVVTGLPTDLSTSTPIPASENTATILPAPIIEATNTALPASAITSQGSMYPIQFAPNGTYVDILESIKAGEGKTYSINAMKGQVMSIAVRQNAKAEWTSITMRIVGADDSVLCAGDCEFWRGVLPLTQDYYVTVSPAADATEFVMRVAINPPGAVTQSFVYENKYRNASLSHTDRFAPAFFAGAVAFRIMPELALQFIDTESYTDTNLIEAYLLFGSSTDPQVVGTCTEPATAGAPETLVGDVTVNGVSFTKSESSGVGAGNVYEQTYYRALQTGTCFEITYFIHYGNIGNYDPGAVTEFDRAALMQEFDGILSTFTLR